MIDEASHKMARAATDTITPVVTRASGRKVRK